jgi:hypothetical protein
MCYCDDPDCDLCPNCGEHNTDPDGCACCRHPDA